MNEARPLSRRRFLRHTAARLGAALAVPSLVPGSALGLQSATAPSERIAMGFIGLGGQGSGHLLGGAWTYVAGGYVARPDVQVRAVCDVRRERREHARERCQAAYAGAAGQAEHRGVEAYNDFRELLARPDIDAVLIAVPYHWAAPLSVMAMQAGKDVYCEKPIAITVQQGRSLIEAGRRFARVYQAGTQQRSEYGGKFRLACELIRNGRLGQLREVYAYRPPGAFYPRPWTSEASQPVPPGFDWDLWLGPLPWRPYNGEAGHALGGCFLGDVNWAPHHYDIIQWTVNADPRAPIAVDYEKTGPGAEDCVIHYRYANGVVVHSTAYPGEAVGPDGGACFVGTEGRLAVDRGALVSDPASLAKEPLRPADERVYRVNGHSDNFLECVRTRRAPICEPATAVYTMNAILIGGIAMALQRSLRWDPVQEVFPGDDAANRLLSYTPRPPWYW